MKRAFIAIGLIGPLLVGCGGAANTNTAVVNHSPAPTQSEHAKVAVVDRPQKIKDLMAERGEQDNAAPTLKILAPIAGTTIASSTVRVKLELSGDLKGYKTGMDPATHTGNHIHVILDNQPYEAYYELDKPFELRNVADGEHTVRVFPSRPWHESYKNDGAFQMVRFTVRNGGADTSKPATAANGSKMADAAPTSEGKDMQQSNAAPVDPAKPLLTYSRPKGEYKGDDAKAIMLDFWLSNGKLKGDGGEYRVRYFVDGGEAQYIDKWAPIWLAGFTEGKHTIELQLVGKDGTADPNGGYNSTTREITIAK
jgi:hypothetical protein